MSRKPKRNNSLRIVVLLALIGVFVYVNQVVVPTTPPLFIPTATPTRAPDTFIKDAGELLKKGKINQAIETYKEAVKADPHNPAVYVTLARWQVLYGDYDGAMENVQNALLINPNHALAHAVRGLIMGKQKKYLDAESEIKTVALEEDPNSALAWAYLTEVYVDMMQDNKGDLNTQQKAIDAAKEGLKLDSGLMETHRAHGLVLEATTQHDEATKEYEAAVAINPSLADLYVSLGREYRLADAYDKSVDVLMKGISLRPDDPAAYSELAATYLKAGDFSKGAQIAEQAVQHKPDDPFLQGLLGTMYYKTGDYASALPPLRLAVRGGVTVDGKTVTPVLLDPKDQSSVAYYERFGIALSNVGKCGEALQLAQELLQKMPDDEYVAGNTQVMIDTCKQQADNPPTKQPTGTPGAKASTKETAAPAPTQKQ